MTMMKSTTFVVTLLFSLPVDLVKCRPTRTSTTRTTRKDAAKGAQQQLRGRRLTDFSVFTEFFAEDSTSEAEASSAARNSDIQSTGNTPPPTEPPYGDIFPEDFGYDIVMSMSMPQIPPTQMPSDRITPAPTPRPGYPQPATPAPTPKPGTAAPYPASPTTAQPAATLSPTQMLTPRPPTKAPEVRIDPMTPIPTQKITPIPSSIPSDYPSLAPSLAPTTAAPISGNSTPP